MLKNRMDICHFKRFPEDFGDKRQYDIFFTHQLCLSLKMKETLVLVFSPWTYLYSIAKNTCRPIFRPIRRPPPGVITLRLHVFVTSSNHFNETLVSNWGKTFSENFSLFWKEENAYFSIDTIIDLSISFFHHSSGHGEKQKTHSCSIAHLTKLINN